jgi:hypothetical protein
MKRKNEVPIGTLRVGEYEARRLSQKKSKSMPGVTVETWVIHETGSPGDSVLQSDLFFTKGQWHAWTGGTSSRRNQDLMNELAVIRNEAGESVGKKKEHNSSILGGIPAGVWADHWATGEEEKGESFSGVNLMDVAPAPPAWAKKWAKKVADEIVEANHKSLDELYELAESCGYPNDREHFGYHLGMQVAGHGVSWEDDADSGCSLKIKLPHREFYE